MARLRNPQRLNGPESEHDQVAFARQHPIGFAHHGKGIGFEFEGVRQDHGVDRAIGNRQL